MQQHPADPRGASPAGEQIELQSRLMDRGRSVSRGRGAKKRATLPSHSLQSHPFSDSAKPSTPEPSVVPAAQRMSYTAPQRGGKARQAGNMATTPHRASSPAADQALRVAARTERPARSSTFHSSSFGFESPSALNTIMAAAGARKRSRTFETSYDGAADDEGHSKGGHSLRKRARIDYTQEMIEDESGLPTARSDLVVKPASTPSARGRKRKGGHDDSGEDSEDFTSHAKRHRIDKSPGPTRAAMSRRRNPSKKLSTDVSTYIDQPSDNDVQDTILVSVPTGLEAQSEEESEYSSFANAESRPSSSGRSEDDAARPAVQMPLGGLASQSPITNMKPASQSPSTGIQPAPQSPSTDIQPAPQSPITDIAMSENHKKALHPTTVALQPRVLPANFSLTQSAEVEQPKTPFEMETARTDITASTVVQTPETITPHDDHIEMQTTEVGAAEQIPPHLEGVVSQQTMATDSLIATTPTSESKETDDSKAPLAAQNATPRPSSSRTSSRQELKHTGPTRIKSLERVYKLETPFASHLKLTPYEDEDIALPGPHTELVYPTQTLKEESAPIQALTPAPTPLERKPTEFGWAADRPLRSREFFALYTKEKKRRQGKGEPPLSMPEFHNECLRRYKSTQGHDPIPTTPSSTTPLTTSSTVVPERPILPAITSGKEVSPQGSQLADSRLPTAAPSPAPIEESAAQEDGVDDEQDADKTAQDQTQPTSPGAPVEVTRNPNRQYAFPKLRDPSEFTDAFQGWQEFSPERLFKTTAAAVETMHAYQQEYNEMKKWLDDEDNSKRRQAYDKTVVNWENRQKADEPLLPRRHFDDPVKGPAPFEVRGPRAPKPYIDDPILEHEKEEDRIMAQAHGFRLNTHPTQVGRQNPEEQRWEMSENRLRKRTEKGAELAEENVVEGKRVRKPRHVSDQSKDVSRAATPTATAAFGPGRRQRRKPAAAATNDDEFENPDPLHFTESFSESPRKARTARTRGMMLPGDRGQIMPVAEADNNRTEDDEVGEEEPKVSRRRGRGGPILPEPPTSAATGSSGEVGKPKRRGGGKGPQLGHQVGGGIASSSFYSNVSAQPESRPSTSSSENTAHTAETTESAYSLREKRKRNFALENDPELEARPTRRRRGGAAAQDQEAAEPKKRGPRKKEPVAQPPPPPPPAVPSPVARPTTPPPLQQPAATNYYHNFVAVPVPVDVGAQPTPTQAGPLLHTFAAAPAFPPGAPPPPPPPPAVKKPMTKIKITNNGASSQGLSRASTPANGSSSSKSGGKRSRGKKANASSEPQTGAMANGDGDLDKPYAEMTKSEKMSFSMRRRWASGEMQGAVEKRRTTLAIKKAEKAAGGNTVSDGADANAMGQMTDSGSAGPSGPTTPASMHGQPGSGLLAFPQAPPMLLQPPQHHQGFLQQPPSYPYAMPPGPPGPMS